MVSVVVNGKFGKTSESLKILWNWLKISLCPSKPLVPKICLLPKAGLPLSGSSECLETMGVEKVEKMIL